MIKFNVSDLDEDINYVNYDNDLIYLLLDNRNPKNPITVDKYMPTLNDNVIPLPPIKTHTLSQELKYSNILTFIIILALIIILILIIYYAVIKNNN